MTGPEAAQLAGITYRQLDYWARCGWVTPSAVDDGSSRRRRYRPAEVVRLALLGHLGRSGVDVRAASRHLQGLVLDPGADEVVVWDGSRGELEVVPGPQLRGRVSEPGNWVVFDPRPVWARLGGRADVVATATLERSA